MSTQRIALGITIINVVLLIFNLTSLRSTSADSAPPILRGRGLEIVDDNGKIRASITTIPADPSYKMPDGTIGYPETVLFRLINSKGRPNVKIEASENGAGIGLGGESDPTYATLSATGADTSLKLTNKDSKVLALKP